MNKTPGRFSQNLPEDSKVLKTNEMRSFLGSFICEKGAVWQSYTMLLDCALRSSVIDRLLRHFVAAPNQRMKHAFFIAMEESDIRVLHLGVKNHFPPFVDRRLLEVAENFELVF